MGGLGIRSLTFVKKEANMAGRHYSGKVARRTEITSQEGNTYGILRGDDICDEKLTVKTFERLSELMDIDEAVYQDVYAGNIDGYLNRFGYIGKDDGIEGVSNPDDEINLDPNKGVADNIIAITKDDKIIGYINYLTMGDELHHEIIHPDMQKYYEDPTLRDDGITGDQLQQWTKEEPNHLFILSIAIRPEYQDTDVVQVLTDSFREELIAKEKEGYHIGSITGDTVSDHGEDALRMMRFACAKENGEDLVLPPPPEDPTAHVVTVRICEGENLKDFLEKGMDFSREKLVSSDNGINQSSDSAPGEMEMGLTPFEQKDVETPSDTVEASKTNEKSLQDATDSRVVLAEAELGVTAEEEIDDFQMDI